MKPPVLRNLKDGVVYTRRADIEQLIDDLTQLSELDVVQRCVIKRGNQYWVPNEALFHLVRRSIGNPVTQKRLFDIFALRLRHYRYDKLAERVREATLEEAFDRLIAMLAADRRDYQLKLDFYEVWFDRAFALLVIDALRSVRMHIESSVSLDDTMEAQMEAEGLADEPHADSVFDLIEKDDRWTRALSHLTERQRKVVVMLAQGLSIDPKDPNEPSIPKILKISKRTASGDLAKARPIIEQYVNEGAKV